MQKIDIDLIIDELKKSDEWEKYKDKLNSNLNIFWKDFSLEKVIFKGWLLDDLIFSLVDNSNKEADIEKNNFWNWTNREKNFPEFKKLELKFLDLFLENIKFCPYCWKIPLIRYENDKKEKKWTFHLDHIFPKSKYRYLTYNFYNLIPACSICNQFKWAKDLYRIRNKIFHPYFWWLVKDWISLKLIQNNFDNKINFEDKNLSKNYSSKHFKFFNLDKIYLNSQDTKNDIWFIRDKIEKIKTEKINSEKLEISFDLKERKDLFFKNYYPKSEEDILKYSNWKFKKDLIENLKL